jgi:hypothetical protein
MQPLVKRCFIVDAARVPKDVEKPSRGVEQVGVGSRQCAILGRHDVALPFGGRAGADLQARPGHGQGHGAHRAGDRAPLRPVTIPDPGPAPARTAEPSTAASSAPTRCSIACRTTACRTTVSISACRAAAQSTSAGRLLWQRRHRRISSRCAPPRASRLLTSTPPRRYATSLFHNYRDAARGFRFI